MLLGFLSAFGVVLVAMAVAFYALKRLTHGWGASSGRVPMQVLQRVALGPKQGAAVVQIGERFLVVSTGEGGVRTLVEMEPDEIPEITARVPDGAPHPNLTAFTSPLEWGRSLLRYARRGTTAALLALAVGTTVSDLSAQAPPTPRPAPSAQRAEVPNGFEQTDRMVSKIAPQMDVRFGGGAGQDGLRLSGTVGVVVMMGLLTLLPTLLLMMTSFTRIFIVLSFLKQALGTQGAPPAHLMAALSLLLTGFVMAPTIGEANRTAITPWLEGRMDQSQMMTEGVKPFRSFMLDQTRERDLLTFMEIAQMEPVDTPDEVPLVVLMSAFVTSELKTSFQIGFALFLPFIVIDLVAASVLMSMGMFMLPPAMIALPFKLLLFVLVDGWTLVIQGLVQSFR